MRQTLLQRSADVIHIVDGATENFSVSFGVKVFQRQACKLIFYLLAHRVHHPLRHTCHEILLEIYEHSTDNIESAKNE